MSVLNVTKCDLWKLFLKHDDIFVAENKRSDMNAKHYGTQQSDTFATNSKNLSYIFHCADID